MARRADRRAGSRGDGTAIFPKDSWRAGLLGRGASVAHDGLVIIILRGAMYGLDVVQPGGDVALPPQGRECWPKLRTLTAFCPARGPVRPYAALEREGAGLCPRVIDTLPRQAQPCSRAGPIGSRDREHGPTGFRESLAGRNCERPMLPCPADHIVGQAISAYRASPARVGVCCRRAVSPRASSAGRALATTGTWLAPGHLVEVHARLDGVTLFYSPSDPATSNHWRCRSDGFGPL